MAFNDLLGSLTRRADAQIESVLASARDEAARLRRDADRRSSDRSATELQLHARAVTDDIDRAVREAARTERAAELGARMRARERVFDAVRIRLAVVTISGPYRDSLPDRVAAAVRAVGEGPAEIRSSPDLEAPLAALVHARPHLTVASDPGIGPGFTLRSADGRVEVDEILDHRLSADSARLGQIAVRELGGPA